MILYADVKKICDRYCAAKGISHVTLCSKSIGNGRFLDNMKGGHVVLLYVDRLIRWLSDNWPEGLEWPAGAIPRPTKKSIHLLEKVIKKW